MPELRDRGKIKMQQRGRKIVESGPPPMAASIHEPVDVKLAGRATRLLAFAIDMALVWLLPVAIGLTVLLLENGDRPMSWPLRILSWLPGLWVLATVAWQLRMLSGSGQTLGKRITGICIVRTNGMLPEFWALIGRRYALPAVIGWIPLVGWLFWFVDRLAIFFTPQRQCLRDRFADTLVVKV